MDRISVVIAAYNQENEIEKAVRSALSQDYGNLEVIVVNDGSTDRTGEVLSKIAAEDPRLYVIEKENGGVSAARNDGIRAAAGRWLITLDGDDDFEPGIFTRLAEEAEKDPETSLVITGMSLCYPDREERYEPEKEFSGGMEAFLREQFSVLYDSHLLTTHCNKLYDLSVIKEQGIFFREDLRINEDIDFVFRYLKFCRKIHVMKGICIHYVQHGIGESQIGTFRENGISSSMLVLRDLTELVDGSGLSEKEREPFWNRMLVHILSFTGIMYRFSGYETEKKRRELEKVAADPDFRELLKKARPGDLKTKTAVFLLRNRKNGLYHLLSRIIYHG